MNTDKNTRDKIAVETFNFLKETKAPADMNSLGSYISRKFDLSESEKNDRYPSGDYKYLNMIRFSLLFFKKANLAKNLNRGEYVLTEKGKSRGKMATDDFAKLRKDISKKSNKDKRAKKTDLIQTGLFGVEKRVNSLTVEELELLSKIVEQNNKIVEKIINK